MRGAVAVLVDVTPLRRLETVRRDFVANASHELKTPLTSIRGYAETLLSDAALPDDLRHRFLTTIHDNAARLHRIVEDLLDLSRLESGGWRPVPRPVDIAGVAADVWEGLHHIAERKAIGFAIDAASQPTALGDPVGVRQILANLLDNAIRYTPDGGRVTVRVARSNRPGRRAGAGPFALGLPHPRQIPGTGSSSRSSTPASGSRATRSRVFERFYRVDPARSREAGGTGLGLAIVKHLVGSMGGDVVAESELGKGSTFRFWLPAATAPAESRESVAGP